MPFVEDVPSKKGWDVVRCWVAPDNDPIFVFEVTVVELEDSWFLFEHGASAHAIPFTFTFEQVGVNTHELSCKERQYRLTRTCVDDEVEENLGLKPRELDASHHDERFVTRPEAAPQQW